MEDSHPKSFGEFAAAVLSAMDTSAYVPASVATGLGWFLAEVRADDDHSMTDALQRIADTRFGGAVVAVAAVFVVAAVIQPFQYSLIRLLEGYHFGFLLRPLLALKALRRDFLDWRLDRASAVVNGRANRRKKVQGKLMASNHWFTRLPLRVLVDCLERAGIAAAAREERTQRLIALYPARDRLLPLALGNRLRSYEDKATERLAQRSSIAKGAPTSIEEYFPSIYHELPAGIRLRHDQLKGRLEGYCTLVFVFAVLAVAAYHAFGTDSSRWYGVTAFGGMALTSKVAALSAADDYGRLLVDVAQRAVDDSTTPDLRTMGPSGRIRNWRRLNLSTP